MRAHRRHDIKDKVWERLEPHLPGRKGSWGGVGKDNRQFINAIFWIFRTGAPWRDLPPDYGDWSNTHRRFISWRNKGVWEKLLELLIDQPDYEWLMIDASHCKVHPHAAGAKGGNQDMGRTKGGSIQNCIWPWMRMVCRSGLLLHKVQQPDCTQASHLIQGLTATYLLADRGYDSQALIEQATAQGMVAVIPPRKNRKVQRFYDKELYKMRHRVENAFLHLKRWRGIATRYAKNTASFLAAIHIRCIALWTNVS